MPFASSGVVDPEALRILRGALEKYCSRHPLADKELAAMKLLNAYRDGVHEENTLLRRLARDAVQDE